MTSTLASGPGPSAPSAPGTAGASSKRYAFVTLLTSDDYLPGALVTAHSLREAHARDPIQRSHGALSAAAGGDPGPDSFDVICLVTPHSVRVQTIKALCSSSAFDRVLGVEPLSFEGLIQGALAHSGASAGSGLKPSRSTVELALAEEGQQAPQAQAGTSGSTDASRALLERIKQNLQLLGRPDLGPRRGAPLSKLHAWRLTQYEKVVFLDADTLVLQPLSHLFGSPAHFAAAPDIGWPDAFNSGVLVLRPSLDTFAGIRSFAAEHGSWDGADQGLLNDYFGGERGKGEEGPGGGWERLSFRYNVTPSGGYTYAPAYRRFGAGVQVAHFIGEHKPWHRPRPAGSSQQQGTQSTSIVQTNDYDTLIRRWHEVFSRYYPLPESVDRHSSSAYSVEVIHSARGVEIVEREIEGGQSTAPGRFHVPTYEAVWNAHQTDASDDFRPGQTEDLRSLFAGGATLYGLSTETQALNRAAVTESGLGKYAGFPLDGRTSLIPLEGLPADLLEIFAEEEREAEEARRIKALEAQRERAALSAQASHPEGRAPAPPPPAPVSGQSGNHGSSAGADVPRPWSPPKMAWDPSREPPPATVQGSAFAVPSHFDNAWDHRSAGGAQGEQADWTGVEADADARVTAARVPRELMQGMYAHLAQRPPDASKVQAVFPWEQPSRSGGRSARGSTTAAAGSGSRSTNSSGSTSTRSFRADKQESQDRRRKIQAHAAEVLSRLAEQQAREAALRQEEVERGLAALGEFDGKPTRRATRVFPDDPPRMQYAFQLQNVGDVHSGGSSVSGGSGPSYADHHDDQYHEQQRQQELLYQQAQLQLLQQQQLQQQLQHQSQEGWAANAPQLSALEAEAEAAEAEVRAESPPVVKRALPPKLAYSNAWDYVSAIGDYADGVEAAQSPGPGGLTRLLTSVPSSGDEHLRGGRGHSHLQRGTVGEGRPHPRNGDSQERARSGERAAGSTRRVGAGADSAGGALGMEMGELAAAGAAGSGSGEGDEDEDSHDGDDESSSGEHSDEDERGGNGYRYGVPASVGGGGGSAPINVPRQPATVGGALGLTDEQFPEVTVVEAGGRSGHGRRRAESKGYLRKAEATHKAQVTASPRSPRHHALRGSNWTQQQQQQAASSPGNGADEGGAARGVPGTG